MHTYKLDQLKLNLLIWSHLYITHRDHCHKCLKFTILHLHMQISIPREQVYLVIVIFIIFSIFIYQCIVVANRLGNGGTVFARQSSLTFLKVSGQDLVNCFVC